jgi:hypothetical protein
MFWKKGAACADPISANAATIPPRLADFPLYMPSVMLRD